MCHSYYHAALDCCWCATVGWVLSSFFIGYLFLQIPGGWLSQKFGAKWLFGTGVLATSLLTLITPVAADLSVWALIAVRVLEGFFEVSPCILLYCIDPLAMDPHTCT